MRTSGWMIGALCVLAVAGCDLAPEGPVYTTTPVRYVAATPSVRCTGKQPVRMKARPLSPYIYQQGDGYAYFDVWIQACPAPGRVRRQPLDVALVVDTSGSMGGRKIGQARAAAMYLLGVMNGNDRLSLVTYNTRVYIQFPLTAVTAANRGWMAGRIRSMYASGMTNLGGGLSVGAAQLTQARERNSISRVILISDGLTNVGVVNPGALSSMAAAARQRRASVTTMGVGLHFNEVLLQNIAEYGGGRYHYISRAQDLVAIFRQEIRGAQAIVATGIDLRVRACPGCRVESVLGYAVHRWTDGVRVAVSDLAGGETMKALVKVKLPMTGAGARKIGLRLSYKGVRSKRSYEHVGRVSFRVTRDLAKVRRTVDKRVAGRVARVQANRLAHRAMTAYKAGNSQVAGRLMQRAASRLRSYGRRYKTKRYSFEAAQLSATYRMVRKYRKRPSKRRHLIKKVRSKASSAYRH